MENFLVGSMSGAVKICPIEYGVILTPFGTIAPGTIISAIAASLEPEDVNLRFGPSTPNPPGISKGYMHSRIREF